MEKRGRRLNEDLKRSTFTSSIEVVRDLFSSVSIDGISEIRAPQNQNRDNILCTLF